MNKKIITLIIAAMALIASSYFFFYPKEAQESAVVENLNSQPIHISVNADFNPASIKSFGNESPESFKSLDGGTSVSFRGAVVAARNPGSNVYLNNVKIGEVGGQGLLEESYSTDTKYFTFRVLSICGAGCQDTTIYVVDLTNKTLFTVLPPRQKTDFTGDTSLYMDRVVKPFIASYDWGVDSIKINFFFIGVDKRDGKTYRISPKTVWNYDMSTKTYTLLQTIPE